MPRLERTGRRRARLAGLSVVAILLLTGCGTPVTTPIGGQGAAATPTYDPNEFDLTPVIPLPTKGPEQSPMPIPTQDPNAGFSLSVTSDFAPPPTAEQFASWYDLIVSGTVTEILPAQWGTPDGKRPKKVDYSTVPDVYPIITPAVITLDGAPLVDRYGVDVSSGSIVVAAFGGQVGKDQVMTNDQSQHLEVGEHLLMGLSDHPFVGSQEPVHYQTPAGPAWTLGMVYWLEADGLALAAMPYATPVATQNLMQAIQDAARANP